MNSTGPIFGSFDWAELLDRRPLLLVIAGPNGAGKTTFYETFLASSGLPFLNADVLARELCLDAYAAAGAVSAIRDTWIARKQSFIFETVFSDPIGEKVELMKSAADSGFAVALFFIGVASPKTSNERVGLRVTQGGHDVPWEKLTSRFPRTLENLRRAIGKLPLVFVYDNNDLAHPYRQIALSQNGVAKAIRAPLPKWLPIK